MGLILSAISRKIKEYTLAVIGYQQVANSVSFVRRKMDSAVLTDEAYHEERFHKLGSERLQHRQGAASNSNGYEACRCRLVILDSVMGALNDVNVKSVGVCGWEIADRDKSDNIVEKAWRRAKRDNLFDVIVKANVTQKPNLKRIQDEIADTLRLKFDDEKVAAKRAGRLCERIKQERRILVVLCEVGKGLDFGKVGIPVAADHVGCKVLLTSASYEVLSKQMNIEKIFGITTY